MRPPSPKLSIGRRSRVERIKKIHDAGEQAALFSVGPIGHTTRRLLAVDSGVEFPDEFAVGGIQSDYFQRWSKCVESASHNHRIRLQAARPVTIFAEIEFPGDLQSVYVFPVDLSKAGIMVLSRLSAVDRPILRGLFRQILSQSSGSHYRHGAIHAPRPKNVTAMAETLPMLFLNFQMLSLVSCFANLERNTTRQSEKRFRVATCVIAPPSEWQVRDVRIASDTGEKPYHHHGNNLSLNLRPNTLTCRSALVLPLEPTFPG